MVSNTEYYDFFISYRREKTVDGNSEACVIYNTLRSIDPTLKIFYDIKELGPGDFRKNLEKAIKKSRRYVFLVNKDSWREVAQNGGDDWYYNEIGWAFKYLGQDKMLPIVKDKEEFRRISVGLPESIQKYFRDKHQIYNLKEDLGKLNKIDYDHVDAKLAYDICTQFGIQKSDKIDYSKFCFVPDFLTSKKLYGREEYAKRLYKLFFKNHQPIVSIVAMGGMGKTAFAHIYKSKYKSKYKHIHHIYINNNDLRGTFIDKMQTLISDAQFNRDLETFGDEGKMTQIIRVLKDIPAGPNLLVIDINNVSKGITDFFDGLISSLSKKWHILVLSRTSFEALENYRFVPFDSLVDEPQIAVEMFRDISGVKASECSDNEIGEIFARDGFNYIPILIETLSAHCKREHQYWNYNALCDAIDISRNSSIKYNPELRHSDSPEIKTVSQYLQKLISIEDFDTSSQKIMQHFVLWNCDYVPSESIKKLLSVYNLDDIDVTLEELVNNRILETTKKAYLGVVPLESFVDDGDQMSEEELVKLQKNAPRIYVKTAYKMNQLLSEILYNQIKNKNNVDYAPYITRIREELRIEKINRFQELSSLMISSLLKEDLIKDCDDLVVQAASHYYYITNERSDKKAILEYAIKAAERVRLKTNDNFDKRDNLALALHDLARVLINQQRWSDAILLYTKSLAIRAYNMPTRLPKTPIQMLDNSIRLVLECYCLCLLNKDNKNELRKYIQQGLNTIEKEFKNNQNAYLYILQFLLYKISAAETGNHKQQYNERQNEFIKISKTTNRYSLYKPEPELVTVAGGRFVMGDNDKKNHPNEYPAHNVTIRPYRIGKYPVTQFQWDWVMNDSVPSVYRCEIQRGLGPDYPMYNVTWYEAAMFCNRLSKLNHLEEVYTIEEDHFGKITNITIHNERTGYRLPTEAEWEFAARKVNPVDFWYEANSSARTHPVGKLKNGNTNLEIYDMLGNIGEWCQDWYDTYTKDAQTNPTGPQTGKYRIVRGGGWGCIKSECSVYNRNANRPEDRRGSIGFRVALPYFQGSILFN